MITREKVKAHLKRRKIEYIVGGITIQSLLFIYMGYRIGSFTSKQESVAPTVGVEPAKMSKHINGHMDNVNGCHYRIVGLSTNA